jgi:hypothetical protein
MWSRRAPAGFEIHEALWNLHHRHSTLGYPSPAEFEDAHRSMGENPRSDTTIDTNN